MYMYTILQLNNSEIIHWLWILSLGASIGNIILYDSNYNIDIAVKYKGLP